MLPMEVQIGDRFTDHDFEWEVVTHPAALHGGKSLRARIQRPGLPETQQPFLLPWVRVLLLIRSITSTTWLDARGLVVIALAALAGCGTPAPGPPPPKLSMPPAAQPTTGERWAVVVGIGAYDNTSIAPARYAVADAEAMYQMLIRSCANRAPSAATSTRS